MSLLLLFAGNKISKPKKKVNYDGWKPKQQFNDDEEILTIAACMPLITHRRTARLRFSSSSRGMVVRR